MEYYTVLKRHKVNLLISKDAARMCCLPSKMFKGRAVSIIVSFVLKNEWGEVNSFQ